MAFFPKLNISYIEIPVSSDFNILKKLIDFEMFDGVKQSQNVYNRIVYNKNGRRNDDFRYIEWWRQNSKYVTAMNAKTFSVVMNPYERLVFLFHYFTKNKILYKAWLPEENDELTLLQNKFENFSEEFLKNIHVAGGVGLNIVEGITRKFLKKEEQTLYADSIIDRYLYLGQTTILNPSFKIFNDKTNSNHYFIYNEPIKLKIHIIKKERARTELNKLFPTVFDANFDLRFGEDILNIKRYPYIFYYTKRSKKICQEAFEQDFYQLHYNIDLKI